MPVYFFKKRNSDNNKKGALPVCVVDVQAACVMFIYYD